MKSQRSDVENQKDNPSSYNFSLSLEENLRAQLNQILLMPKEEKTCVMATD